MLDLCRRSLIIPMSFDSLSCRTLVIPGKLGEQFVHAMFVIVHVREETANGLGERLRQLFVVWKMIPEHGRDSFFLSPMDAIFFDFHPTTSIPLCDMFGNKAGVVFTLLAGHVLVTQRPNMLTPRAKVQVIVFGHASRFAPPHLNKAPPKFEFLNYWDQPLARFTPAIVPTMSSFGENLPSMLNTSSKYCSNKLMQSVSLK